MEHRTVCKSDAWRICQVTSPDEIVGKSQWLGCLLRKTLTLLQDIFAKYLLFQATLCTHSFVKEDV